MPTLILVLLGTSPHPFDRLVSAVDIQACEYGWDVFMQIGHTSYIPKHCNFARFLPHAQIQEKVKACELMIVQGGAGSIHEGLAAGKPVIAVPRQDDLGEAFGAQEKLVLALSKQGRIIGVYDVEELATAVKLARSFHPTDPPPNVIPKLIQKFIESL
jgi:UDP-N-acetylglucosamine transferase subunit ALG13